MRQRMDQRSAAKQGVGATAWHLLRRNQSRLFGPPGLVDRDARRLGRKIDPARPPVRLQCMHACRLVGRLAGAQADGQSLRQPV
jgi:hypothetical protein